MRVAVDEWEIDALVISEDAEGEYDPETNFEISPELFARYMECMGEFTAVQEELQAAYDAQRYHPVATPDPSGGAEIV